jgi:energy-coupling factor transporter ATP-binding protein EcfA2
MRAYEVAAKTTYRPSPPERNPEYLRFVRGYACSVCGRTFGIEASHTGPHGIGQKASDRSVIPLCRKHHRTGNQALHKLGPVKFAEIHGIDVPKLVVQLNERFEFQQERKMSRNGRNAVIQPPSEPETEVEGGELLKQLRASVELNEARKAQQPGLSIQAAAPSSQPSHTNENGGRHEQSHNITFANDAESTKARSGATATIQNVPQSGNRLGGFHRAVKFGAKARVAFIGVSGGGKSYTMLTLARALAGPTGKIACVDTEHGSLSKYADLFEFDVDEPTSYTVDYLLQQLTFAEQNGYAVFCIDSLSHFWMGKDGALEFVDNIKRRTRDQFEGWKYFRPHERTMVDRFIASPCHVIVTMRTKTDYEEQIGQDGKKRRVKIGLAPVQRDGLEYEFDLVCCMDDENTLLVDKTRCSAYAEEKLRVSPKPAAKYFEPYIEWLAGVKLPDLPKSDAPRKPWTNFGGMVREFARFETALPPELYARELAAHGVERANQFRSANTAWECYQKLQAHLVEQRASGMQAEELCTASYEHFLTTEGEAI